LNIVLYSHISLAYPADLTGDGSIELVVSTTQTVEEADGGRQMFVFTPTGSMYQPGTGHNPAWPRYNYLNGTGNDRGKNDGYGQYGLNVGIGSLPHWLEFALRVDDLLCFRKYR